MPPEVLVNVTHGPEDVRNRPAVRGKLFKGADLLPFSAGVDSRVDHIGTVSGWHSQDLNGQGYNQWLHSHHLHVTVREPQVL